MEILVLVRRREGVPCVRRKVPCVRRGVPCVHRMIPCVRRGIPCDARGVFRRGGIFEICVCVGRRYGGIFGVRVPRRRRGGYV